MNYISVPLTATKKKQATVSCSVCKVRVSNLNVHQKKLQLLYIDWIDNVVKLSIFVCPR